MSARFAWMVVLCCACGKGARDGQFQGEGLPCVTSVPLTTEQTIELKSPAAPRTDMALTEGARLQPLLDSGLGDTVVGPGAVVASYTVDGSSPPASGNHRRLLTRFVHLADTQLADDESPARVVSLDTTAIGGAFRPQEAWGCRILNAAVRTINALHDRWPIEFVILGGDNTDNAQRNEVDWFTSILDGAARVECDSGKDDDPVVGPGNDPKDAFMAEGLRVPWRWVTGNHDILHQGVFSLTASSAKAYTGTQAELGTIDWSSGMTRLVRTTVADAARVPLARAELLSRIAEQGDGHGLREEAARHEGKAFYALETALGEIRLIVLDTAAETGGADGLLRESDVEFRVRPLLEKAEQDNVHVILLSHHSPRMMTDGSGFGGTAQTGAMTAPLWRAFLGGYPHVMMQLSGHSHTHHTEVSKPAGGHAVYEIETASLMDWPGQLRLMEVWDEDNGFLRIRALAFDFSVENDPVAADGRRRSAADYATGGSLYFQQGAEGVVDLWFPRASP